MNVINVKLFQIDHEGADGPVEPGPVAPVQHQAGHDPGREHPASPNPLQSDHPRVRVPGHCGGSDGNTGETMSAFTGEILLTMITAATLALN